MALLQQQIITSLVCVNQACFPRDFAQSFCSHSSSKLMAFTLERAKQVGGPFEVDCTLLAVEGACAVFKKRKATPA
eukprot:616270-Pelagomonas_calceolata.AAC.1